VKPLPLSVFIIARNESDRITHTLESVRGLSDDIIVIDSGSTDDTCAVAERLGARVVFHEWKGYGPQKVFGETLCRHDWLLNLDADEALTPGLVNEIRALFATGEPSRKGYKIHIKALFRFQKKLPWFAVGTWQLRLYHRKHAGFKDSTVHDSVVMNGNEKAGALHAPVLHRCFRSHTHAMEKINFYSSMQAEDAFARNRKPSSLRIAFEPFIAFFKSYFLRGYIFYGLDGIIQSYIYAYGRLIRLAKIRERFQERDFNP